MLELPLTIHRARLEDIATTLGTPDWISLQGVALHKTILKAIGQFAKVSTRVIWISSDSVTTDVIPIQTLTIPITGTRVLVFQGDLS
jgi:hypothetical protein